MSENQRVNPNEAAEEFFENEYPGIASSSTTPEQDSKSLVEQDFLFAGGLDDIDVWIKHEEVRLKFLEFKLKKKTQIAEVDSTYKDRKNERRLRKENAKKAFLFSSIWAVFIAIFIIVHGLKSFVLPIFPYFEFEFSVNQTEFIFVCGTLTASVLIFYLTVIKNLFPNKPDAIKKSEKSSE